MVLGKDQTKEMYGITIWTSFFSTLSFHSNNISKRLTRSKGSLINQIVNQFLNRTIRKNNLILLFSARDFGFPSIINQFVWHPPFRKRTMASILFARWTPNHNRRLIDGFSTAQRQHSKSPVRKVPCFSGRTLSLHILYCISKEFFAVEIAVILQKNPRLVYKVQS